MVDLAAHMHAHVCVHGYTQPIMCQRYTQRQNICILCVCVCVRVPVCVCTSTCVCNQYLWHNHNGHNFLERVVWCGEGNAITNCFVLQPAKIQDANCSLQQKNITNRKKRCTHSSLSISVGLMISPPRLMTSLLRAVTKTQPWSSKWPTSPVLNHPSVNASAVALSLFSYLVCMCMCI